MSLFIAAPSFQLVGQNDKDKASKRSDCDIGMTRQSLKQQLASNFTLTGFAFVVLPTFRKCGIFTAASTLLPWKKLPVELWVSCLYAIALDNIREWALS